MRIASILIITFIGIQPLIAEEPTVESLALKIKILEEKVAALSGQVEASSRTEQLALDGAIVINVRMDGRIEVEGKIVSDADIAKKLQAIAVQVSDKPLKISASKETKYNDIVRVIDLCKKFGISKISLTTEKIPDEQDASSNH